MENIKIKFFTKNFNKIILDCEVAKSFNEKANGLMYRKYLDENNGMFFPFFFSWHRFFWMKNVKIPLDIIFVNRKLKIIAIFEAPVEKKSLKKIYWSHGFCKYVIECNMGFCKKNNITINDIIKI